MNYKDIMADLKAGKYAPVYYLMGEESYYIDRIADYIADNALKPEERDFNQTILFGSDVTASAIVDAARRYPMMAERQVVIVKEAQNIRQTDALEKYMKQPLKSTILVICHKNGKVDGRKREYVKAIQAAGILFESPRLRDRDLPPFIEAYLSDRGVAIDAKSTQLIADAIGADLSRIASELDKLILALSARRDSVAPSAVPAAPSAFPGAPSAPSAVPAAPSAPLTVTPQLVEEQIGISKDFNGFELRDAIVNRNVFKANQIINYFDKNPKAGSIYAFLPLLFNYFQNLMLAHYCPQKHSQEAVAAWLEFKSPWAAKDYMTGMRNFTAMKTMQIISKLREMDAKSKGLDNPNTPPGELMKELICYILH